MRTSLENVDDPALRERVLGGDGEATEELYRRHLTPLYEFCHYRLGGDRSAVEDVVQDTFVVALEELRGFDGRSSLHTWLCGIAKNKIRSRRRKRRPVPLADVLAKSDAEIDEILSLVDTEPLPDWVMERRETQDLVGATLSSLTPEYREVLIEKYIDGSSVADMASRRDKGTKATESLLHRSRLAFARVFQLLARKRGGLM